MGRIATPTQAALASIVIAALVMALKFVAWWLTGSVAFYADALESIINILAALMAFAAVRWSHKPADANHPFGHQKAEFLSAIVEGVLILVAAWMILAESVGALLDPAPIRQQGVGMAVIALATGINAVWAMKLMRWARQWRSPALRADSRHLWADVVTSAAVLAGVALIPLTGWGWLDPALGLAVTGNVLWSGLRLVRESLAGLMDEMVPAETLSRIETTIADNAGGAVQAHDLRARHLGRGISVEFHLVVPGSMTVLDAHAICDRIETALQPVLGDGGAVIHVEPDHKAKRDGAIRPENAG
jgi:cation diffusion facilitator family transporter